MKNLILTFLCLFFYLAALTQSYQELVGQAEAHYQSKEYKKSIEQYLKAFKLEQKNPLDLYNGACSAALSGDKKNALRLLSLAVDNGWTNIYHLKSDSDLNSLHQEKKWVKLTDKLQKKVDLIEANYDKPLQKELLAILEDDQGIRQEFIDAQQKYGFRSKQVDSLGRIMIRKDSINLAKVTKILDEKGWVGRDKIGGQANQTLFLVIQHADLATQQKYLPMMREAVKNGKAEPGALALLEDRVAIREGRRQIYGSQIGRNDELNRFYVLPLDDPDNVDKRRESMGLGPLSEYVMRWEIVWDAAEYKKMLPEIEKWSRQQGH